MKQRVTFALPGELSRLTGGTIYDRRVVAGLSELGVDVTAISLPDSFPNPSRDDMQIALTQLAGVGDDTILIVDGLAYGALDPAGVAQLQATLVPLVHHPLAQESGLSEPHRTALYETERRNLEFARGIVVPSQHTAGLMVDHYGVDEGKITVARPGTDKPTRTPKPVTPPLILSVGIQMPRKGHDVMIKALAQVRDLAWNAVIVGAPIDADFADALTRLSQQSGLEGRLVLAGQVERETLDAYYSDASLFALATRYEGYGIVFDEALAYGLPIISCATGAVNDTVPEGTGVLTPPDDPDEFASALRTVLTDNALRQSLATNAATAGQALPSWLDTAQAIASALAALPSTQDD